MGWLDISTALALFLTGSGMTFAETEITAAAEEAAVETLHMQIERYRRMTVPVTVNGQGPFPFMIDTGAQATVLSNGLADQLQLTDRRTATLIGIASQRQVETAVVDELTFGSHSNYSATAALVDGSNIGGADGILGLDSLQDRRVLLDFENRVIEIAHDEDQRSNRGYDIVVRARRIEGQLIIARANVDGVRTAIIVDTGAQGSIGNTELFERMRRARQAVNSEMTDINGVRASNTVRFARKLEMGRAELSNFPISFTDSPTFEALGIEDEPALILGMSELRLFKRVAIDFASRRILFDLPDDARLPSRDAFTPVRSSISR